MGKSLINLVWRLKNKSSKSNYNVLMDKQGKKMQIVTETLNVGGRVKTIKLRCVQSCY